MTQSTGPARRGRRTPQAAAAIARHPEGDGADIAIQPELDFEIGEVGEAGLDIPRMVTDEAIVGFATTLHVTFDNGMDAYLKAQIIDRVRPGEHQDSARGRVIEITNEGVLEQLADLDERLEQATAEAAEAARAVESFQPQRRS